MAMTFRVKLSSLGIGSSVVRCLSNGDRSPPPFAFAILPFSSVASEGSTNPNLCDSGDVVAYVRKESTPQNLLDFFNRSVGNPSFRNNDKVYKIAARKLATGRNYDAVKQILDNLVEASKPCTEEIAIRVMRYYGRAGMPDQVSRTFENLESLGISPSVRSFNYLLSSLVYSGNPQMALDFFNKAEKFSISPDCYSYNALINILCKTGDHRTAIEVLDTMKERGFEPDIISYSTIMHSIYSDRTIKKLKRNELLNSLFQSSTSEEISYNCRLCRFCKDKDLMKAGQTLEEMLAKNVPVDGLSVNTLIIALCRAQRAEDAKEIYDMFAEQRRNCSHGCNVLVRSLVQEGRLDLAIDVLEEMLQRQWVPDPNTVDVIVESLVKNEQAMSQNGESLIERMRRSLPPHHTEKLEKHLLVAA
eukprot:TRINITY_DN2752_c0_g2_i1.p1 TRINITY_DN2752_c0_g2~~TRINITY_DN2752_c0_g2_i1.p1  ORF type:complete len:417 (-),score=53.63 TRINITY_DN2752_c0_g2_i1:320-1570(-)